MTGGGGDDDFSFEPPIENGMGGTYRAHTADKKLNLKFGDLFSAGIGTHIRLLAYAVSCICM